MMHLYFAIFPTLLWHAIFTVYHLIPPSPFLLSPTFFSFSNSHLNYTTYTHFLPFSSLPFPYLFLLYFLPPSFPFPIFKSFIWLSTSSTLPIPSYFPFLPSASFSSLPFTYPFPFPLPLPSFLPLYYLPLIHYSYSLILAFFPFLRPFSPLLPPFPHTPFHLLSYFFQIIYLSYITYRPRLRVHPLPNRRTYPIY